MLDEAQQLVIDNTEDALKRHRSRAQHGPHATGSCLACGAKVPKGRRWCDADCRDDWERGARA